MIRTLLLVITCMAMTLGLSFPAYAQPLEGQDGWSCVDHGNRICGPGNEQGVPAGQYDQGGVLIPWPHEVVPAWCRDICLGA